MKQRLDSGFKLGPDNLGELFDETLIKNFLYTQNLKNDNNILKTKFENINTGLTKNTNLNIIERKEEKRLLLSRNKDSYVLKIIDKNPGYFKHMDIASYNLKEIKRTLVILENKKTKYEELINIYKNRIKKIKQAKIVATRLFSNPVTEEKNYI